GCAEDYDATREPDGWQEKAFPPAVLDACPNAALVPSPDTVWANYEPRPTPYLRYDFVAPARISAFRAPGPSADAIGEGAEYEEAEALEPVVADLPFDLDVVNGFLDRANAFTLDLGKEYVGHIAFEIESPEGRVLEISGAELLRDGRPWIVRKGTRDTV